MNKRLNEIETSWEELFASHARECTGSLRSQALVLQRYYGAVWSYLFYLLKDSHLADDFSQEFALRFLRGDFCKADPQKGRFRDFLKVVLRNMVLDYFRRGYKQATDAELSEVADPIAAPLEQLEQQFNHHWRVELLRRTWDSFRRASKGKGPLYYESLLIFAKNGRLSSDKLAEHLASIQGDSITASTARQILHRARRMFADCLRQEVRQSLANQECGDSAVEDELRDLQLTRYLGAASAVRSSH